MSCKLLFLVFFAFFANSCDALGHHRTGPLRKQFPAFTSINFPQNRTGKPLFVTPYLNGNKIKEVRELSRVTGELGKVKESYSGYFTVNKKACNSNLFFWFIPATYLDAKTTPVALWLQGGPGGSSMFGLFNENGPYKIIKDMKVVEREEAWTKLNSVLYIDNPVGTGFSFTGKDNCYTKNQEEVANDLYEALLQFYRMFPEYSKNPFFVTGESYAGKYIPSIAYKIHQMNNPKSSIKSFKIPLAGIAIGDGLCDPETMTDYGDFLFGIGLIDEEDRAYFKKVTNLQKRLIQQKQWFKAFQVFDNLLNGDLTRHPSYFANATGYNYYFNYLMTESPKEFGYYPKYLQQAHVRKNIHVGNLTFNDGSNVEKHLLQDIMKSAKPQIQFLLDQDYRVMIYNGQMDVIIAWPLTESFITSMKWKGAKKYLSTQRIKWHVDDDLAGYVKVVDNFTQVLVRNAGHMVPYDQPIWAFDMINRFTYGKKFA